MAVHAPVHAKLNETPVSRLRFDESSFSIRDGEVNARCRAAIEGVDDSAFALELDGLAIGRRLVGTALRSNDLRRE